MTKANKRRELLSLSLDFGYSNAGIIYQIINSKKMDVIISKITPEKVCIEGKTILKQKYLSAEEQFLMMLNRFVGFIDYNFPTINYKDLHIEYIMEYQIPEFLLSKLVVEDNNNINYFDYQMKKTVVYNFYDNIAFIYNEADKNIWKKIGINPNMRLENEEDVDSLFLIMKKIAIANINEYSTLFLFSSHKSYLKSVDPKKKTPEGVLDAIYRTRKYYAEQYSILLRNYIDKKKYIDKII